MYPCSLNIFSFPCVSAGLLGWRAVRLSLTSPSSGSRPSGTPPWGRSRPFTLRTPTSTHTWTTSARSTAALPSPSCQPPGASALQMVNKVKRTPTHKAWCICTHMHNCTQPQHSRNTHQSLSRPLKMIVEIDWCRLIAFSGNLDSLYQFNSCLRSEEVRWEATRSISIKTQGLVQCYLSEGGGGWNSYEGGSILVGGGAGWREANPFDLWVMSENLWRMHQWAAGSRTVTTLTPREGGIQAQGALVSWDLKRDLDRELQLKQTTQPGALKKKKLIENKILKLLKREKLKLT